MDKKTARKHIARKHIAKRAALRWRALTAHVQHKATRFYKPIVANSGFQYERNACVHTNVGITKLWLRVIGNSNNCSFKRAHNVVKTHPRRCSWLIKYLACNKWDVNKSAL